jgi:hypothetical protein
LEWNVIALWLDFQREEALRSALGAQSGKSWRDFLGLAGRAARRA